MAYPAIATINGQDLPEQFSYQVYVQKKRNTTTPTANAVVLQHAPDQIIHGDSFLKWKIEFAYPPEYQDLYDLYNTAIPVLYTFVGYWGESYDVYFSKLSMPQFRGRLGSISGEFQIVSIITDYSFTCNQGI